MQRLQKALTALKHSNTTSINSALSYLAATRWSQRGRQRTTESSERERVENHYVRSPTAGHIALTRQQEEQGANYVKGRKKRKGRGQGEEETTTKTKAEKIGICFNKGKADYSNKGKGKGAGYNKGGKGYNYSPSSWSAPSWNYYNNYSDNKGKERGKSKGKSRKTDQLHTVPHLKEVWAHGCQLLAQEHYYLHNSSFWFSPSGTLAQPQHFDLNHATLDQPIACVPTSYQHTTTEDSAFQVATCNPLQRPTVEHRALLPTSALLNPLSTTSPTSGTTELTATTWLLFLLLVMPSTTVATLLCISTRTAFRSCRKFTWDTGTSWYGSLVSVAPLHFAPAISLETIDYHIKLLTATSTPIKVYGTKTV